MFDLGLSSYLKIGAVAAVIAVVGMGYWHYTGLLDQVSSLKVELADKDQQLQSAKAAVEALNEVTKAAEVEQAKSATLQTAVAKARALDDVQLPKPLTDAFLKRFGADR